MKRLHRIGKPHREARGGDTKEEQEKDDEEEHLTGDERGGGASWLGRGPSGTK